MSPGQKMVENIRPTLGLSPVAAQQGHGFELQSGRSIRHAPQQFLAGRWLYANEGLGANTL